MKKTIKDYDIKNKKVIIRVDFNVPVINNEIADDNRIRMSLPTIKYAIEKGAKVILMSHLGRIKTDEDTATNSLKIVSDRLSELLGVNVIFVDSVYGKGLETAIDNLNSGEVLLMENTRFMDLNGNKESNNDITLGKYWASLGDIFINDAFGVSHRECASLVGIAANLPNGIGFLIEKELNSFSMLNSPKRPYTIILGGSKVSDKIKVINNLINKCDYMLIGGAMSNTFMVALGYNVGNSKYEIEYLDYAREIIYKYKDKLILPVDSIVLSNGTNSVKDYKEIRENDICYDIGIKTIEKLSRVLELSKTVVWNGPLGYFEKDEYSNGTKKILKCLSNKDKCVIIGGGDTASAAINNGYKNSFTHISTGGGASLELLEGKSLPGIDIIEEV